MLRILKATYNQVAMSCSTASFQMLSWVIEKGNMEAPVSCEQAVLRLKMVDQCKWILKAVVLQYQISIAILEAIQKYFGNSHYKTCYGVVQEVPYVTLMLIYYPQFCFEAGLCT